MGAAVFLAEARRREWRTDRLVWVALWGLVGGVFGARLAEKIKQMLWRDRGERAVPSREAGEGTLPVMRKAA